MNKNVNSYLKGVGSGFAKTLLTMTIGLWMVPFTLQFLTKAEYGVFAIAGDILLWLGLLQLGTGASLSSRAAQLIGRRDTEKLGELASTALVLQTIAALLTMLIGGFLSLTIDGWFAAKETISSLAMVFFLLVLGASIQITAQVFNGLLVANKQVHVDNLLGIGLFLLQTALTIGFLLLGLKLMALALSSLIATVFVSGLAFWRVHKQMPEVRITIRRFKVEHVRDLLGNGIWFTVGGLAGILIMNLDRFMVGHFVSLEAVTAFIITGKLYFIADKFHGQIFNVMRPYLGQLHGRKETSRLSEIYHAAFSSSLLLSVLMASTIYVANKWFISWWLGADFYLGDSISLLFALNFVMQSSVVPNRILLASTLYMMPQQNIARVCEGLLNLLLTIILAKNYGIVGVLIGSLVANLLFSAIILNVIARSYFKSRADRFCSLYSYSAVASLVVMIFHHQIGWLSYLIALIVFLLISFSTLKNCAYRLLISIVTRRKMQSSIRDTDTQIG